MKLSTKIVSGVVAASVLGGAAVVVLGAGFSRSTDAHPPCDQLPTVAAAAAGLAGNQGLAEQIKALHDGIAVEVGTPCADEPDRALIMVSYSERSERDAIRDVLKHGDGFGVPVHLVKR